jgi:hypothetical protein
LLLGDTDFREVRSKGDTVGLLLVLSRLLSLHPLQQLASFTFCPDPPLGQDVLTLQVHTRLLGIHAADFGLVHLLIAGVFPKAATVFRRSTEYSYPPKKLYNNLFSFSGGKQNCLGSVQ